MLRSRGAVPAVDDRDTEAARRHGVPLGRQIFMKGDLQARDAWHCGDLLLQRRRWMSVAPPMGRKQHHAVTGSRFAIVERPFASGIKTDQRFDPGIAAIEIGPLVGETQVALDDAGADRLQVHHSGVAAQVRAAPGAGPVFDRRLRPGADLPVVESALDRSGAARVPAPFRLAVNYHQVTADMVAVEQGRPEMTRSICGAIIRLREQPPAAHAHALQIVDRLGENRIMRRVDAVRRGVQALALGHGKLVVNPAVSRIPQPGVAVLSRYEDVGGAGNAGEILHAPRIDFANRHLFHSRTRWTVTYFRQPVILDRR